VCTWACDRIVSIFQLRSNEAVTPIDFGGFRRICCSIKMSRRGRVVELRPVMMSCLTRINKSIHWIREYETNETHITLSLQSSSTEEYLCFLKIDPEEDRHSLDPSSRSPKMNYGTASHHIPRLLLTTTYSTNLPRLSRRSRRRWRLSPNLPAPPGNPGTATRPHQHDFHDFHDIRPRDQNGIRRPATPTAHRDQHLGCQRAALRSRYRRLV